MGKSKSKSMKSEKSKSKKSKSKSKSKKSKSRTVELNTAMGRLQALSGSGVGVLLDLPDPDSQIGKLDILASSNFNEDPTEQVRQPLRPPLDFVIEEDEVQIGESTSALDSVFSRMGQLASF